MDTWTSSLLNAFLWTTRWARSSGRPCLAYAVDAGGLSPSNQLKVRRHASKTDLIITRTAAAAERLRSWGVKAPIEVTADVAFDFALDKRGTDLLEGWTEGRPLFGLAAVDFYLWPVVARPFGKKEDLYRWLYYFSRSPERDRGREELASRLAALADEAVEKRGMAVALVCMEQLDEPLARTVLEKMRNPRLARVFSSREHNAYQLASLLRHLDALVTSRYHAAVLSLAAPVPMVALGHDRRLQDLFRELGIEDRFFLPATGGLDWEAVSAKVDLLIEDRARIVETLRGGFGRHMERNAANRTLLRRFLQERGWEVSDE